MAKVNWKLIKAFASAGFVLAVGGVIADALITDQKASHLRDSLSEKSVTETDYQIPDTDTVRVEHGKLTEYYNFNAGYLMTLHASASGFQTTPFSMLRPEGIGAIRQVVCDLARQGRDNFPTLSTSQQEETRDRYQRVQSFAKAHCLQ